MEDTSMEEERKQVEGLIRGQLMMLELEQEVVDCQVKCLDSGGLHFSSDVREVELQLQNNDGTTTLLQLIVKLMPDKAQQIENSSKVN